MGVYGSNYDYGESPYYKDDGEIAASYSLSFWYRSDLTNAGILLYGQPDTGNKIIINGATGNLEFFEPSNITPITYPIPTDSNWHFVLLNFIGLSGTGYISIDLGASTLISNVMLSYFVDLFKKGVIFIPYCPLPIFDLRIYSITNYTPVPVTTFTYYYNDVLAQGKKTQTVTE